MFSDPHKTHNTLCVQNVQLLNFKLVVHKVTILRGHAQNKPTLQRTKLLKQFVTWQRSSFHFGLKHKLHHGFRPHWLMSADKTTESNKAEGSRHKSGNSLSTTWNCDTPSLDTVTPTVTVCACLSRVAITTMLPSALHSGGPMFKSQTETNHPEGPDPC